MSARRRRAPRELRDRIELAIVQVVDGKRVGIVALAMRIGVATNTLYRIYRGDSVNSTTISHVESHL